MLTQFISRLNDLIQFKRGYVTGDTWEDNPLYPKDIKSSVQHVPIKNIVSHQETVKGKIVKEYKKKPGRDLPTLHKVGSKFFVEDGNHRIVAKINKGEKTVRARVFEKEKELSEKLDNLIQFRSDDDQPRIESSIFHPIKRHREHQALEKWVKELPPSAGVTLGQLKRKYPETKSGRRADIGGAIGAVTGAAAGAFRGVAGSPRRATIVRKVIRGLTGAAAGSAVGGVAGEFIAAPKYSYERLKKYNKTVEELLPELGGEHAVHVRHLKSDIPKATTYSEVAGQLKKQDVGFLKRHAIAAQTRPIIWSGSNAAFIPEGGKGLVVTAKKVHPAVFRHEAGHGADYAHHGGKEGFWKAYPHYAQRRVSREDRIASTMLPEERAWAYANPRSKRDKKLRDQALYTYRYAMGLSALLDDLIQLDSQPQLKTGPKWGEIAKDAVIGGGVSALGTAGLLAGAGKLLRRRAPELAGMLGTAAGQHIKVFNPMHSIPMMRSLPEASRLFGKQLRSVRAVEDLATTGKIPSIAQLTKAARGTKVNPQKDIADIASFKKQWGRTPGETMEKSVGILSGLAATGVGAGGGAALSKGWQQKPQNAPKGINPTAR